MKKEKFTRVPSFPYSQNENTELAEFLEKVNSGHDDKSIDFEVT